MTSAHHIPNTIAAGTLRGIVRVGMRRDMSFDGDLRVLGAAPR